jgi:hypothetical protein
VPETAAKATWIFSDSILPFGRPKVPFAHGGGRGGFPLPVVIGAPEPVNTGGGGGGGGGGFPLPVVMGAPEPVNTGGGGLLRVGPPEPLICGGGGGFPPGPWAAWANAAQVQAHKAAAIIKLPICFFMVHRGEKIRPFITHFHRSPLLRIYL